MDERNIIIPLRPPEWLIRLIPKRIRDAIEAARKTARAHGSANRAFAFGPINIEIEAKRKPDGA
jgi:hypothetical protein